MTSFEKLDKLIQELKSNPYPKLVEGKRDKIALEYFDIKNIVKIHEGSLAELADSIESKEVVILTDFDRRGELIKNRLIELLKSNSIKSDLSFRKKLRLFTGITYIEHLVKRYEEIKNEKINVKKRKNY